MHCWTRCFSFRYCWISWGSHVFFFIFTLCGFVGFTTGHFMLSCPALCSHVFPVLLGLWSPRLGKRELIYVLLLHFVWLFCKRWFCLSSLLLCVGVSCGLWLGHSLGFSINFFVLNVSSCWFQLFVSSMGSNTVLQSVSEFYFIFAVLE